MAIDIGGAYLHKSYMQNAADGAALAGVKNAGGQEARLITVADVPVFGQYIKQESSTKADAGADAVLTMDTAGKWQTAGDNVRTELRKEVDPKKNNRILKNWAATYYYKVELTDNRSFQFAGMFLPEALLPSAWKVNVEAWAKASNLSGIDLLTMMKTVEDAYGLLKSFIEFNMR